MKQINFEADFSNTKWVHPNKEIELRADCPNCGQSVSAWIAEDEYPRNEQSLYFECRNCNADFTHPYKYEKVIYTISIPDSVTVG